MDNVQLKPRNYFGSSRILNHLSYFSRIYTTLYENISEENSVSLALLPNSFIQLTPRRFYDVLPSLPSFLYRSCDHDQMKYFHLDQN